jgi:S1-C subfamily serine protease
MSFLRIAGIVLAGVVTLTPPPASAFDTSAVASVVSVLPAWPDPAVAEGRPRDPEGSGVAVFENGYIATADHVIGRAATVDVRLGDGRRLPATVIGRDPPSDVALLKIDEPLPVPPVNRTPVLGSPVCAVGNPFGLGLSISCGVVSALHRTGTGFNPFEDFIQTDAAVNPGGSGGGLFDADGRLIGMTSAIFTTQSDGDIGVNFAASIALVLRVAEDLRDHGRVLRARSGMTVTDIDDDARRLTSGVRVSRIQDGSGADNGGIAVGDIVTHVGDRAVHAPSDVTSAVFLNRRGDTITVDVVRNGASLSADIVLD